MKRFSLISLLLLFGVQLALAQQNFIQFDKTEHDFGNRKEEEETLEYSFKFKNTTNQPIKLIQVKAGCGCTTPSWTTDIVQPNQEGFVKASYGAKGRPGPFNKSVTVKAAKVDPKTLQVVDSNDVDNKILYIKGDVAPRPKGVNDFYPIEDGNLRFSTNHLAFGNIKNNEVKSKDFTIYNQGKKPITITGFKNDYSYINIQFPGKITLQPKDSTKFSLTFDAAKSNEYDWTHVTLSMLTDDDSTSNSWYKNTPGDKKIYVSATIEEFFDPQNLANAPAIQFEKEVHDFGTLKQGDKVSTTFVFKNVGKSDLIIRKSKASCGCTATQPEKTTLKPGESSKIDVTFDSTGKEGPTSKTITVVCNDPNKAVTRLEIKCNIQKPESAPSDSHAGHNH
jgi:uncharacterized cupredoxin-like copper-binding protein